jgi:8-oxo-dGTP diphosphatase
MFTHRTVNAFTCGAVRFGRRPGHGPATSSACRRLARRPDRTVMIGTTGSLPARLAVSTAVFSPPAVASARPEDALNATRVLVIRRRKDPFRGCFSLPGGAVRVEEGILPAARRELSEETGLALSGIRGPVLQRSAPGGWVVHVCVAVCPGEPPVSASDDAEDARFVSLVELDALQPTTPGLAETVREAARGALTMTSW